MDFSQWLAILGPILYLASELIGESPLKSNSVVMLVANVFKSIFAPKK